MNSRNKSKGKNICVLIYVLRHEGVSGCVGILSYILNLEARCCDWSTSCSGRLNFWEITIGKLRRVGWAPEPV
jgi:hypothetical protein